MACHSRAKEEERCNKRRHFIKSRVAHRNPSGNRNDVGRVQNFCKSFFFFSLPISLLRKMATTFFSCWPWFIFVLRCCLRSHSSRIVNQIGVSHLTFAYLATSVTGWKVVDEEMKRKMTAVSPRNFCVTVGNVCIEAGKPTVTLIGKGREMCTAGRPTYLGVIFPYNTMALASATSLFLSVLLQRLPFV